MNSRKQMHGTAFALARRILSAGLLLGCLPSAAMAQTFTWNNASGGSFHNASNWTPTGVPGVADTALFDLNATYTVNMTSSVNNSELGVVRGTVNLSMSSGTTYSLSSPNSVIGYESASLNVSGGTMLFPRMTVGYFSNTGSLRYTGPAASFATQSIIVGYVGPGNLDLQSGATGSIGGWCVVGDGAQSNGKVQVLGTGSSLILSGITIGAGSGNGSLHIDPDSAVVNFGSVTLAQNAGSNATVNVYGTWNNDGAITFGAGNGTINLNGGTLSLQALNPGSNSTFNFNEGTVRFNNDWTGSFSQVTTLLGSSRSLSEGKTLEVGGTATLQSLIRLQGGTFRAGTLVGASNLAWSTGTVEITNSSVTIGSGGLWPVLNLGSGMTLRVTGDERSLTISSNGVLNLNGGTATGPISNYGEINLGSVTSTLGQPGQFLNNSGRLVGTGRMNSNLSNNNNGRIIVDAGQRLVFHGTSNNNLDGGTLELSGGTLEFTNTLTNNAGGFISGRGVFRGSSGNTGGVGLDNRGAVAFSGGVSDVSGKVNNTETGQVISAGSGVLTFHDDVVHNGTEIRTTAGSRTVFFGAVSGSGAYTGTGTVEYQGDLRPGNSPANVIYSGGVVIGASATSQFEIGGTLPGSEYDRLTIAGAVTLDGHLNISLLNGFTPIAGQQFTLIDNQSMNPIQGTFFGISEGSSFVSGGQLWSASYLGGDGNNFVLTAVPEPGTWALILGTGATVAGGCWRKRRREQLLDGRI